MLLLTGVPSDALAQWFGSELSPQKVIRLHRALDAACVAIPAGTGSETEIWHGASDAEVPLACAAHNLNLLPGATCHVIEGFGHGLGSVILDGLLDRF